MREREVVHPITKEGAKARSKKASKATADEAPDRKGNERVLRGDGQESELDYSALSDVRS